MRISTGRESITDVHLFDQLALLIPHLAASRDSYCDPARFALRLRVALIQRQSSLLCAGANASGSMPRHLANGMPAVADVESRARVSVSYANANETTRRSSGSRAPVAGSINANDSTVSTSLTPNTTPTSSSVSLRSSAAPLVPAGARISSSYASVFPNEGCW